MFLEEIRGIHSVTLPIYQFFYGTANPPCITSREDSWRLIARHICLQISGRAAGTRPGARAALTYARYFTASFGHSPALS
ncbi:hypothetical protein EVAR_57820_1 [Eumeta japonica]|uniref:Uncharacterized protein n=1 Tax=Eumeta variegata TaxID=151549 RepID=A0A4C2A0S6_EUMVA|nr:hypothetical protein EVAR_57820_1 [Eumeta japonica]